MDEDPEIEAALAKQHEGGLFEHLWLCKIGDHWHANLDYYTVKDGLIYNVSDGNLVATGDTHWHLHRECVHVGKFKEGCTAERTSRMLPFDELKERLGFD